jgi:hypothetical protein
VTPAYVITAAGTTHGFLSGSQAVVKCQPAPPADTCCFSDSRRRSQSMSKATLMVASYSEGPGLKLGKKTGYIEGEFP